MTKLEARLLFPKLVGKLLTFADTEGIGLQMGEAYRTREQAEWNAQHGLGIANSLHCERLAIDLLCCRQDEHGNWLWLKNGTAAEYSRLGHFWLGLDAACGWGGTFNDAGHFSLRIDARA